MAEKQDWTTNTRLPVPEEFVLPLFKARWAFFKVDVGSAVVHERFSQVLLAFGAGALAAIVGGYEALSKSPLYGPIVLSAILLVCSLVAGAGQVLLGHVVALVGSGLPHEDALNPAMEGLDNQQQDQLLRRVLRELRDTRFWPESSFIKRSFEDRDLVRGLTAHLRRIQLMVNLQALCFRIQLLFVILAALPVLAGLIREAL